MVCQPQWDEDMNMYKKDKPGAHLLTYQSRSSCPNISMVRIWPWPESIEL